MAFDEKLVERVRKELEGRRGVEERKMFGGLTFMVRGNMACGVDKDRLMVRVGPEGMEAALKRPHAKPMDFTGRPMKGFVLVGPAATETDDGLDAWVARAESFASSLPPK